MSAPVSEFDFQREKVIANANIATAIDHVHYNHARLKRLVQEKMVKGLEYPYIFPFKDGYFTDGDFRMGTHSFQETMKGIRFPPTDDGYCLKIDRELSDNDSMIVRVYKKHVPCAPWCPTWFVSYEAYYGGDN